MTTYRTLLPCLLMLGLFASSLPAQQIYKWQQCDTCFKGYDVNWQQHHQFEIGGEDLALPTQGRRDFTMEFGYFYGMPTSLARYADSTKWWLWQDGQRDSDSLTAIRWKQVADTNLKVYAAPYLQRLT